MERYLNALGTVALVAPMLGLIGAVLGIIDVFNDIRFHGTGDANALAGGISEALVTTAAGLIVAVPATIMHRFFNGRINDADSDARTGVAETGRCAARRSQG